MSKIIPWFERRFDFSTPVALLPNLLTRIAGGPARLEDLVRGYEPAALTKKDGAKWSAQEHAGHLADLEALWLARLRDYTGGHTALTVADLTNRKTNEAGHNGRAIDDILRAFRADRSILVHEAAAADASLAPRTLLHPRLGTPLRLIDHLYFVAEHDDHHLAHIRELAGGAE